MPFLVRFSPVFSMSLTRLSSALSLPSVSWTQLTKVSSGSTSTPLPFTAPFAAPVPVTSITSSGTTATATTAAAHGLQTGDRATLAGASLDNYNGTFAVTVTGSTTFTYTMAGSATSPAVGATLDQLLYFAAGSPNTGSVPVSITSTSGVATVTTSAAHGLVVGQTVRIAGASPSDYTGTFLVASVPSSTTFTYPVPTGIASPAVGRRALITFSVPAPLAQKCIIRAAAGNNAAVTFGPNPSANYGSIAAGTEYPIDAENQAFDISAWYFQSTAASQSVSLLFV